MHGDCQAAKMLSEHLVAGISAIAHVDCAVFPPFVHLAMVAENLRDSNIHLGAQNVSEHSQGAYTGEIAPNMLADLGCSYVLVGHSERRQFYHETNETIAKKFSSAQANKLIPVLCIGETEAEHNSGQTMAILAQQVDAILALPGGVQNFLKSVIAYEPVWAIGTGKTATPEYAQKVHSALRDYIADYDSAVADQLQIIYGGSVNGANAKSLFAMTDIDGALVGGASLKVDEFIKIYQQAGER